jgi:serine/threonine protein kinase
MLVSMMSDTAGRRIGPYTIERELGRGGMGAVYEVRHPDVPRPLALKVIAGFADPETIARLEREATLLAQVKHQNVVAVHAFARTEDGRPYVVMDLVPGQSLKTLARSTPMEPARAAGIVRALTSAVSALHARSILHRDLKPENVIVRDDGEPVLLDFGLARHLDARSLTQSGAILGTPAYMAPEQAEGSGAARLDERTDVYGLGAILFELLSGRPPFEGTPVQIVAAVLTKKPVWPDAPDALATVLRKAMEKAPDDRYPTARALGDDLSRFLAGERVHAKPARSRWPVVIGAVAIAGVAALAFGRGRGKPGPAPEPPVAPVPTSLVVEPTKLSPLPSNESTARSFRDRLRWLASPENASHPMRKRVEDQVARAREQGLLGLPARVHKEGLVSVRFLSDRYLAVAGESLKDDAQPQLLTIDLEGKFAPTLVWEEKDRLFHAWRIRTIAISPRARFVFFSVAHRLFRGTLDESSGTMTDFTEIDWRVPGLATRASALEIFGLAISTDGRLVAISGSWDKVVCCRLDGTDRRTLGSFDKQVRALAFSPDDKLLAVGAWDQDRKRGELAILPVAGGDPVFLKPIGGTMVQSLAFSTDGKSLVVGFENAPGKIVALGPHQEWSETAALGLEDGLEKPHFMSWLVIRPEPPTIFGVSGDQNGRTNAIHSWRGASWREHSTRNHGSLAMHSVDLSPDGTLLAVGTRTGEVEVWTAW